ncbi:uncharacterized protein CLUP02_01370 [Colletotrichum lupini]|uniref:Uncharacterized protein n=1 Tax=Colletotrichum lupini TaxID=145971 RepID=A0A9Q8SCT9_9PEZI|nr:uncharacterized protein CLUP02_01370 [Colletotrichum lupini]UQC74718.1 hypothetical protein CLUP02_01370 [Colletotrichum lupini]
MRHGTRKSAYNRRQLCPISRSVAATPAAIGRLVWLSLSFSLSLCSSLTSTNPRSTTRPHSGYTSLVFGFMRQSPRYRSASVAIAVINRRNRLCHSRAKFDHPPAPRILGTAASDRIILGGYWSLRQSFCRNIVFYLAPFLRAPFLRNPCQLTLTWATILHANQPPMIMASNVFETDDGSTIPQLETQRVTLSRNSRNWGAWMRMSNLSAYARTRCRTARPPMLTVLLEFCCMDIGNLLLLYRQDEILQLPSPPHEPGKSASGVDASSSFDSCASKSMLKAVVTTTATREATMPGMFHRLLAWFAAVCDNFRGASVRKFLQVDNSGNPRYRTSTEHQHQQGNWHAGKCREIPSIFVAHASMNTGGSNEHGQRTDRTWQVLHLDHLPHCF